MCWGQLGKDKPDLNGGLHCGWEGVDGWMLLIGLDDHEWGYELGSAAHRRCPKTGDLCFYKQDIERDGGS